jgi:hypothetical protein
MARPAAGVRPQIRPEVFMITYDEPNAEENWQHLRSLCPTAKRISGVTGIQAGYRACAQQTVTPYFFAVDGDNHIVNPTIFATRLRPGPDEVIIWHARNPINGLAYGHGGIKLFPTRLMREPKPAPDIDISTSVSARSRHVRIIASEHRFNTTPYKTWATAFRETVKLVKDIARGHEAEGARALLGHWCSKGADQPLGDCCIAGAIAGRDYAEAHQGNHDALACINDGTWLRQRFGAAHT